MIDVKRRATAGGLLVALALLAADPAGAAEPEEAPQEKKRHPGAISITGPGMAENMKVLGGELGRETVDGMNVGLFVLQAESPERLAPGASGPTHLFNLTFLQPGESGFVGEVKGSLVIEGPGGTTRVAFEPFESHHRALTRLEREGDYRIRVEFEYRDRQGRTSAFPFRYERTSRGGHHH